MRSTSRRVLVRCARQVGKTTTTSVKALHTALYQPASLVLVISPSQRKSDEFLVRVRSLYRASGRPPPIAREAASAIEFVNGSRVISLPGTEGTSRGFAGARLLVLDEAARVDDDIFAAVLPMVGSQGAIWALSTPWGARGWFYDLHEGDGAAVNGWERHLVDVHASDQYDERRISDTQATVSRFVWASDYLCEFEDADAQLFSSTAPAWAAPWRRTTCATSPAGRWAPLTTRSWSRCAHSCAARRCPPTHCR
ncbi:terminase large subunit domain-containing protein [Ornithinimicrobium cerasi]|uniref:terminase large subunit domain-containing protein n=1 Tax=Ornithinimicrobium cerasi TaxID=2248773 RepID=UPI000EFE807D|nr:terminase family protein [Ornithinimicrobium cerasi]